MFELLRRRAGTVIALTIAITAVLALPFLLFEPDETASQEPAGAVFDARGLQGLR